MTSRRAFAFSISSAAPIALADGESATWVEIAKVGTWKGYPGSNGKTQTVTITPAHFDAAIAEFTRCANDIALDYEHQSTTGSEAPAAGWIDEMRVVGDKLEAHVTFTDRAAASVRAREYRYTSPVWSIGAPDRVTGETLLAQIPCVALTNVPFQDGLRPVSLSRAVRMARPNDTGAQPMNEDPQAILDAVMKALGVTDPAAVLDAIKQLTGPAETAADAAEEAPMSVPAAMSRIAKRDVEIVAMKAALETANATIADHAKAAADALADAAEKAAIAKVDGLISMGRALPTQRDQYLAFARSDAAAFDALAATLPEIVPMTKRAKAGESRRASTADTTDPVIAAFKRAGMTDAQIALTPYVTG